METKVNVIKNSEHEIDVKLTYDEIKDEINAAYLKERKNIHMDGFRKGKVPIHMLKKMYGEAIEYKASEDIAQKKFWEVVEKENLNPISTPKLTDLDFKMNEGLSFKIQYEVIPELELKDYTKQTIEKPVFKIKEEDIEKDVEYLRKTNATFEEADKVESSKYKIQVNLEKLDDDDQVVEGTKSEGMMIDLSDEKINVQIVENAQGKKVGDIFKFTFVDEHSHGDHVHKTEYRYQAEITKIEKMILPETDEEFIKKISNDKAANLEEFKQIMRDDYKKYFDDQSENLFTNSLLDTVVKNNGIEAPEGYKEVLLDRYVEYERENAKQNKKYFDENKVREDLKPRAEWGAKWKIFLDNFLRIEKIEVTDEDLEKLAAEEAEKTGISVDKLVKYYKDSGRKESMVEEKVIEFLKENNKVKEVDPEKMEKTKDKK